MIFICFSKITFADVIVFNKSLKYDVDVTYNFCNLISAAPYHVCTSTAVTTIKHTVNNESGYSVISSPPISTQTNVQFVNILSAMQKDETGKVIAESTYGVSYEEYGTTSSECQGRTFNGNNYTTNVAIFLEDKRPLPIITCQSGVYKIDKITA